MNWRTWYIFYVFIRIGSLFFGSQKQDLFSIPRCFSDLLISATFLPGQVAKQDHGLFGQGASALTNMTIDGSEIQVEEEHASWMLNSSRLFFRCFTRISYTQTYIIYIYCILNIYMCTYVYVSFAGYLLCSHFQQILGLIENTKK